MARRKARTTGGSETRVESVTEHAPPWLRASGRPAAAPRRIDVNRASLAELGEVFSRGAAKKLVAARERTPIRDAAHAVEIAKVGGRDARAAAERLVGAFRREVALLDVAPAGEHLISDTAWALELSFAPPAGGRVELASVTVRWRGEPFVVEQAITPEESDAGRVTLRADAEHALPSGPAEFCVTLYDDAGGADSRTLTAWLLPGNPFSLFLSPGNRSIYNAEIRPDWADPNWITWVTYTFVNGDESDVFVTRPVQWSFWDGPVGSGTRVESGSFELGGEIRVPARGQVAATIGFSSPPGSGVANKYESKEDMAVELAFIRRGGAGVRAETVCRVMVGWGINIIHVGDYTNAERATIDAGVADARSVFENHGLTFSSVGSYEIAASQAGGFPDLGDEDEWSDLLDDWTVPNGSVDVFVVRSMWSNVIGNSPTPGPAGKDGTCEDDGLAVQFGLGCLAHELGHYLAGLQHPDDGGKPPIPDNVMNSVCGGRSFSYQQYRGFLGHGYTHPVR